MRKINLSLAMLVMISCGPDIETFPKEIHMIEHETAQQWLIMGQSNAYGQRNFSDLTDTNVVVTRQSYNADFNAPNLPATPLEQTTSSWVGGRFGERLAGLAGRQVTLYEGAVGSTSIACWIVGGQCFEENVRPYEGNFLSGVVFWQGESDALGGTASEYKSNLEALITGWRDELGNPDLPFLIVSLQNYWPDGGDEPDDWAIVRDAQESIDIEGVTVVNIQDLTDGDIHPSAAYTDIGYRLAEKWLETQ